MAKLTLAALNALPHADFVAALGPTVEHAPWVAERVHGRKPFASLTDLFAAMRGVMLEADRDVRLALLRGHPQLAGLAARSGSMTAESQGEQSGAGLDALSAERARIFDELNAAYTARHGFPFVIAVRRHGADSILREFRRRSDESRDVETETALAEILRIVALRLDAALEAEDRLPVCGHLSTHVLDTHAGEPAAGVGVDLFEIPATGAPRLVVRTVTTPSGRPDAPLIAGRPIPIATYELRFEMGAYFRQRGAALAEPPFLDVVPIRFAVAEPEGHYHVPLTATPWSYATYRGS